MTPMALPPHAVQDTIRLRRTTLYLNPDSEAVRRDLADRYVLHRRVMSGFPATLPPGERVLFLLGADEDGIVLLVQSLIARPEWPADVMPRRYLVQAPHPASIATDVAVTLPAAGAVLPFRLRANPTQRTTGGRRVALEGEDAWRDWLERKGAAGGFRPLDVRAADDGLVTGYQPLGPGLVRPLSFRAVEFAGRLMVTGPARLAETLRRGIGSGKGFGFGLLLLRFPLRL